MKIEWFEITNPQPPSYTFNVLVIGGRVASGASGVLLIGWPWLEQRVAFEKRGYTITELSAVE